MQRLVLLVTGVLLMTAGSAFAQDTGKVDVSAGWRYYHAAISSVVRTAEVPTPNDYSQGWFADVATNLSAKFAIVGEVGGTYHSDEFSRTSGSYTSGETLDVKFHTFMGGVRVRAPQKPSLIPFGQVLFGGERDTSASTRTFTFSQGAPSTAAFKGGSSGAVLGLDGGVMMTAGIVGVRASVGYVRFFSKADADAFRLSLGAAFRF